MQVASVNIGSKQSFTIGNKTFESGIYKMPAAGPVEVTVEGLRGDVIHSTTVHGGPDQAIYVYGGIDYAWWTKQLGRELEPGSFGENLTITDLASSHFKIGDRLHIGKVVLEVTGPRMPCPKLAKRMNDRTIVKQFRTAVRPGFYCRVIESNMIAVNEVVTIVPYQSDSVTIAEIFKAWLENPPNAAIFARILAAPIASNHRRIFERKLADNSFAVEKERRIDELAAQV